MNRFFVFLLWLAIIVGVCIACDQILLRMPFTSPAMVATQTFYRDFRGRLLHLTAKEEVRIEVVKEKLPAWIPGAAPEKAPEKKEPPAAEVSGYVYTDKAGGLHMAPRLEDVPKAYRAAAKPLQK